MPPLCLNAMVMVAHRLLSAALSSGLMPRRHGLKGNNPVHGTGIKIGKADAPGKQLSNRAFPGPGGAVNRYDIVLVHIFYVIRGSEFVTRKK